MYSAHVLQRVYTCGTASRTSCRAALRTTPQLTIHLHLLSPVVEQALQTQPSPPCLLRQICNFSPYYSSWHIQRIKKWVESKWWEIRSAASRAYIGARWAVSCIQSVGMEMPRGHGWHTASAAAEVMTQKTAVQEKLKCGIVSEKAPWPLRSSVPQGIVAAAAGNAAGQRLATLGSS